MVEPQILRKLDEVAWKKAPCYQIHSSVILTPFSCPLFRAHPKESHKMVKVLQSLQEELTFIRRTNEGFLEEVALSGAQEEV